MTHKYEIILYWSEADQAFIAEVPELSGCMAHGDTPEAALANAQQAIALWLDTAREFGDPIPAPKGYVWRSPSSLRKANKREVRRYEKATQI